MNSYKPVLAGLVVLAAVALWLTPPPDGMTVAMMRSCALIVLTVGFWAVGALPEHLTGLLFFLMAMVLAIAPAQVVFSGFASATLWLVLGGLIMAEAVNRSGLAQRLAVLIFDRHSGSYRRLVLAVVVASIALSFVMPATVGRVLLLVPIVIATAERAGFRYGSTGYDGLVVAALVTTYQCGTGILPANAPNLVLAGAAETLYGLPIHYAEYLWMQFPVMGLVKGALIVVFVWWLFPATARRAETAPELPPMTPEQRRLALILLSALALWATDFLHGVKAGWIALAAGITCVLPRVGVMLYSAFNDVRFGPYFYVAATLGVGMLTQQSGLSAALGRNIDALLALERGADFSNFISLSVFATLAGLFTTNPAQPAVLAPLAQPFAEATGWPLKTALFTLAVGFSTMVLPYQVPPDRGRHAGSAVAPRCSAQAGPSPRGGGPDCVASFAIFMVAPDRRFRMSRHESAIFTPEPRRPYPRQSHHGRPDVPVQRGRRRDDRLASHAPRDAHRVRRIDGGHRSDRGDARGPYNAAMRWAVFGRERAGDGAGDPLRAHHLARAARRAAFACRPQGLELPAVGRAGAARAGSGRMAHGGAFGDTARAGLACAACVDA